MIHHTANGNEFLLVEAMNGYKIFRNPYERVVVYGVGRFLLKDYTIIGLASELTEEQADRIVECIEADIFYFYKDYTWVDNGEDGWHHKQFSKETAKQSLSSLCSSHGMKAEQTLIIKINPSAE